jgi:hypothetical protein
MPENRRKSDIQEEKEEEEEQEESEQTPAVPVVKRSRRSYNVSVSQQESGKEPGVPTHTTRAGPTPGGSGRRAYPGRGGNKSTRSVPERKGSIEPGRSYPGRGGGESTKSIPERRIPEETETNPTDTRDKQRLNALTRTGQNTYIPGKSSSGEDSDEETKKPWLYRLPSPPPATSRIHARFQGATASLPSMAERYPRTDDSYRPYAGLRERLGSYSERRESEPVFVYPDNPFVPRHSKPPKPYQYPQPARQQYRNPFSSDSTGR